MDSLTQLAFAIHASPGAYALVLGSGVSSGAGVPTGWAIVEDLIRRVARVEDVDAADPFAWYRGRFGAEAEYSGLLERLAATPIDRRNILRTYFEPITEERERGEKVPGRAHRAIAELVARGDVRVIVTTNFDPLSETAIREKGVHPQIISTADHVAGSVPLAHAGCTVIKANGDYLDTRIRNTAGELETYDEPLARLIAQVLDEYGVVICGWSADWDAGLRALMNAAPRRFARYWCQRGSISPTATTLIEFRRAQVIDIESADDFFERLAGKVEALRGMDVSHPLSTAALVQEIKHYMSEDRYRIRLADSVRLETKRLVAILQGFTGIAGAYPNPDAIQDAIRRLDVACERVVALLATGFHWATPDQERLFIDAVANIIRCVTVLLLGSFYPAMVALRAYPAIKCLYAAGITAIAGERWGSLRRLFDIRLETHGQETEFLRSEFFTDRSYAKQIRPDQNYIVPLSEHLYEALKTPLVDSALDPHQFDRAFARFEYFAALQFATLEPERAWAPPGRFAYKLGRRGGGWPDYETIGQELTREGDAWIPLSAGLFGGTVATAEAARSQIVESLKYMPW